MMDMRRVAFVLFFLLLAVSCDKSDLFRPNRYSHREGGAISSLKNEADTGGGQGEDSLHLPEVPVTHLYVAGVRYPDGYDWHSDVLHGAVDCSLFLLEDGAPGVELKAGKGCHIASDEDMHRVLGGHLYTDFSTGSETVFMEDGVEIFRIPSREMIRGAVLKDGCLYQLCESRSCDSLFLRCGRETKLKYRGSVTSGLYEDQGRLCFSFTSFGQASRLVSDGMLVPFSRPDGASEARILRAVGGAVYSVHTSSDKAVLYIDGRYQYGIDIKPCSFLLPQSFPVKDLFVEDGKTLLPVDSRQSDSTSTVRVYRDGHLLRSYEGKSYFTSFPREDADVWMICYDAVNRHYYLYDGDHLHTEFPDRWCPHSVRACELHDGILRIGFDTPSGPLLWSSDGRSERFSFNGYIDTVVHSCKVDGVRK